MVGIPAAARNKMMKAFATELAIMVKLRSPRIVAVFGVVTTDPSWMGLVVEYCGGGDLRGLVASRELIAAHMPPPSDVSAALVFVCGPPAMYDALCGPRDVAEITEGSTLHRLGYADASCFKF